MATLLDTKYIRTLLRTSTHHPQQSCLEVLISPTFSLPGGFMYLVAVMDWHSRFVLSWQLSNTMGTRFCVDALDLAFAFGQPEDIQQRPRARSLRLTAFTAPPFATRQVHISMDGRGRALDNIFIERLWRSLKYEDIYIKTYPSVAALAAGLNHYFQLYNYGRPHQSLAYATPAEVYFGQRKLPN